MNKLNLIFIYALAFVVLVLGIAVSCQRKKIERLKPRIEYVTDTIEIIDTLIVPVERERYIVRTDTVKLHSTDTLLDSVYVELPIEQIVYSDSICTDSTKTIYKAFVNGYNASLDSLYISTDIIQQKPIKQHLSRWCWHIGVGAGYGVSPSLKPEPFAGITLSYGIRLQKRGYK